MKKTPFLAWLLNRIQETTAPVDYGSSVKEGEKIVGVMSPDLKILSTILGDIVQELQDLQQEHTRLHEESDTPLGQDVCDAFRAQEAFLEARMNILEQIFWREVREEFFGGEETENIELRRGFKIVLVEQETVMPDFILHVGKFKPQNPHPFVAFLSKLPFKRG